MSIRLHVEANDVEVENLLAYLNSQSELHPDDRIYLLERTVKWLRAADEGTYSVNPKTPGLIRLSFDAIAPMSFPPSDKHVPLPEGRQISQKFTNSHHE